MSQFQQLDQLLEHQDGMLRTGQVLAAGISKPVFYQFVQSRGLEQAAHGIYLSKDAWVDAMYLLHLRCPQAIFSHETALFFHDLTDREPLRYGTDDLRPAPQPEPHGNADLPGRFESVCQTEGKGSSDADALREAVPG